jgi:hypothetical protein
LQLIESVEEGGLSSWTGMVARYLSARASASVRHRSLGSFRFVVPHGSLVSTAASEISIYPYFSHHVFWLSEARIPVQGHECDAMHHTGWAQ